MTVSGRQMIALIQTESTKTAHADIGLFSAKLLEQNNEDIDAKLQHK